MNLSATPYTPLATPALTMCVARGGAKIADSAYFSSNLELYSSFRALSHLAVPEPQRRERASYDDPLPPMSTMSEVGELLRVLTLIWK